MYERYAGLIFDMDGTILDTEPTHRKAWDEVLGRYLGLRHYFSAVVAADHVANHKPAPDTFLLCAERMGVAAEKCVVFEDADFGLQAAKRAGMDAVDVRLL